MRTSSTHLEVTASPSAEDSGVVIKGLKTFNKAFMDVQRVPLAVLVRDEAGVTVGGLLGHTNGAGSASISSGCPLIFEAKGSAPDLWRLRRLRHAGRAVSTRTSTQAVFRGPAFRAAWL